MLSKINSVENQFYDYKKPLFPEILKPYTKLSQIPILFEAKRRETYMIPQMITQPQESIMPEIESDFDSDSDSDEDCQCKCDDDCDARYCKCKCRCKNCNERMRDKKAVTMNLTNNKKDEFDHSLLSEAAKDVVQHLKLKL